MFHLSEINETFKIEMSSCVTLLKALRFIFSICNFVPMVIGGHMIVLLSLGKPISNWWAARSQRVIELMQKLPPVLHVVEDDVELKDKLKAELHQEHDELSYGEDIHHDIHLSGRRA